MVVRNDSPVPARAATPAGVGVQVVAAGGAYEMFELVSVDGNGARVRARVLLEVSEELPLRITRDGASVDVRARVASHEKGEGGAVTQLVFLDGETELRRLLGA